MGKISNLITDMTIKGEANYDEIAAAVRHSMVIIDAEKHHLDWKHSEIDNNILELKTRYQGGPKKGASTLISRASGDVRGIPARRQVTNLKRMTPEQRERFMQGEKIFEETGRTYRSPKRKEIKDPKKMTPEQLELYKKGKNT